MSRTVVFTPEAEAQLTELFGYIAAEASPEIAARFTDGIVTYCESLSNFPARGSRRDDIRHGLRVTGYRRRVAIAFYVDEDRIHVIGVFDGGQDYGAALREEE
jgi:plasmid stabilization system protein ParE